MGDANGGRPYSPLGEIINRMAQQRHIRGPYQIARRIVGRTGGEGPNGSAWSQILYGRTYPKPRTMKLFAEAFDLTKEERDELAYAYVFRFPEEKIVAA